AAFAGRLEAETPSLALSVVEGTSAVGGGAAPTAEIPTALVRVAPRALRAQALADALRAGDPPVVARVAAEAVLLDLRTVAPGEEDALAGAPARAAPRAGGPARASLPCPPLRAGGIIAGDEDARRRRARRPAPGRSRLRGGGPPPRRPADAQPRR